MQHVAQMILFSKVVEAGSFSAAAKALGQTRAAVSKQIAGLEARIGAQLLNRTTRRMHLTEVGNEFYTRCARIAREAEEAERAVASMQGAARGLLRISTPVTFGRRYIAPLVGQFLDRYPEITIDLRLDDELPNIMREGFDVAIRIAALADSTLVARRLVPSHHIVCASPEYFAQRGQPKTPEDLRSHNCLLYSNLQTPRLWRFSDRETVRVHGNFSVNHGESLRQAALDGLGVAYMPTFLVGPDISEGRLAAVLEDRVESNQKVYAVYPRNQNLAPKVRAFIDFLVEQFRPNPPWDRFREPARRRRSSD
jgi:DNA-binding transcriptional LysR family regulator